MRQRRVSIAAGGVDYIVRATNQGLTYLYWQKVRLEPDPKFKVLKPADLAPVIAARTQAPTTRLPGEEE